MTQAVDPATGCQLTLTLQITDREYASNIVVSREAPPILLPAIGAIVENVTAVSLMINVRKTTVVTTHWLLINRAKVELVHLFCYFRSSILLTGQSAAKFTHCSSQAPHLHFVR